MSEYIEFDVNNSKRFERLKTVFLELKKDKDADAFRPDEEWPKLFDDEALDSFYWPTPEKRAQWLTDVRHRPIRITPTEETKGQRWDFFSMIDAFANGEYELQRCEMASPGKGKLEFYSFAYPYGGVGCMVALIEAFGFTVTGIEDGTGFRKMD